MQVRKQQLELDMEQQTGSKSGKEYVKTVGGCHTLLQGISPTQGMNPCLTSPTLAGGFFTTSTTWEARPLLYLVSTPEGTFSLRGISHEGSTVTTKLLLFPTEMVDIMCFKSNTENETHTFTGGWRNSYSLCFKGRNNRKTNDKM